MKEKTTANMHCLTLKTKQTVLRKYVCIKPLQKTSKTLPSKMPPAMLITYTEHKKTQTVQYLHMYTAERFPMWEHVARQFRGHERRISCSASCLSVVTVNEQAN